MSSPVVTGGPTVRQWLLGAVFVVLVVAVGVGLAVMKDLTDFRKDYVDLRNSLTDIEKHLDTAHGPEVTQALQRDERLLHDLSYRHLIAAYINRAQVDEAAAFYRRVSGEFAAAS